MDFKKALADIIPAERIRSRYIDLVSFASDAGFYHLLPKVVVQPVSEQEITGLFQFSQQHNIPLVFRTGGTSLSGQSITDGILVDLSQHWNKISIEGSGESVRVQPGITGGMVNAFLKKHSRKIGPDPASIAAAMMGGILSNNSSGMCCGVKLNSYHTTRYIRFILPDGKIFSTELKQDYERFERECSGLFWTLDNIKQQITANNLLHQKIRLKYQTKNTVGYSLNAFIDHDHPLDILAHLLIGAEGTLAFISEAVLRTVPDYPFKSTALLYFPDIYTACQAIVPLTEAGAAMVELMDRASLHAVENLAGMPAIVKTLPERVAALLIEFQENSPADLEERIKQFLSASTQLSFYNVPVFTSDPSEQAFLWSVRKGLFPAVGAVRASGTTVILEDIAFPVAMLGDAIIELQQLFLKYKYTNGIIFGHAKDGNIHFVITQSFNTPDEITRYDLFMREVVVMVVEKYNGTLKAEHGTGRNMAPFVETEWGGDAYNIMKQIKQAVDPHLLLNPGVIINDDKNAHIKDLKELLTVEQEVDRCIECGFCEHRCPSRDLTTTPRRRIIIRRALQKLKSKGEKNAYDLLLKQYQYDGLDTCAVDGLCATACPVDINTGDLVKRLRRENHSGFANGLALLVAKNFAFTVWSARAGLSFLCLFRKWFGKKSMFRRLMLPPSLSLLNKLRKQKTANVSGESIVYFPACITRMMGSYEGREKNLMETFLSICQKAGVGVVIPEKLNGSCCSQIFSSKGFKNAYSFTANKIVKQLWATSREGLLRIVIDVSSCAYTLHHIRPVLNDENKKCFDKLIILDSVEFLHDVVLPLVEVRSKKTGIMLHPVCSLEKMKTGNKFIAIAKNFAHEVNVPQYAGCCGMAGDRGFLFPELTASATRPEASQVVQKNYDGYYSSTKTCEMAMSEAVGKNYESILYLVDEGT